MTHICFVSQTCAKGLISDENVMSNIDVEIRMSFEFLEEKTPWIAVVPIISNTCVIC